MQQVDKGLWHQTERGQVFITYKEEILVRVLRHWISLPIGGVNAQSLEMFKTRFDGALSNMVQ